jgi:uncharacterized DUF497 family protein
MRLFPEITGFEWDEGNRNKSWSRHGVAWWECEEVFFNQPLYVYPDRTHSTKESRWYVLGRTHIGRLLFIVFTVRNASLRIISARDMSTKERKVYDEKAERDSKI